jgi:galactarate dehydratase
LQCGGSDAFSGVTCNPAVGFAADLLVRAGATVMFSEVTEVRDAVHLLTPRAINQEVARALLREMRWYDDYLTRGSADRSANPTPGNKRGGVSNVVEKALGSIAKSGSPALMAVAAQGEKVTTKGLVFAATPASDFICGTQQLTSMNLHVFTPGEGSPYGLALVPVAKVSSRTALAERWPDLIDIDAGQRYDRRSRFGNLPLHSRCGQRAQENLGGAVGIAQRAGTVQSRADHLAPEAACRVRSQHSHGSH